MGALTWIWNLIRTPEEKSSEGEPRAGPWLTLGGWLPAEWGESWNYWQRGYDPIPQATTSAMVEACISAYAQTIAMLPGSHWRTLPNGGRERITTSALSRILKKPNTYQTTSDFLLQTIRNLYFEGNAYVLAEMNGRGEPQSLHVMDAKSSSPRIVPGTGEIFYSLGGNTVVDALFNVPRSGGLIVPARFVMHLRLHPCRNPLLGETPLGAAMLDLAATHAMTRQQIAFFTNQSRPSTVLTTDLNLQPEQVRLLRTMWDEQTKGLRAGGTPILTAGLKPHALGTSAADAQLAEMMKLSEAHIALAFRVPQAILGQGAQTYASTEALMSAWIASGLGFALNHLELAFDALFGLAGYPEEYTEFDTSALMRSAFKDRIEGLARAVQGGIMAPNEARRLEGYPDARAGDQPRVQQQVVPLTAYEELAAAAAAKPPAGPPPAKAFDEEEADDGREFTRLLADARHDVALLGP